VLQPRPEPGRMSQLAGRIAAGSRNEGWDVPFELAIACSRSVFTGVMRERASAA
jgi:hypothetical protein